MKKVLLLTILSSCIAQASAQEVPSEGSPTQSGSRLKAQYYLGSDGSKEFIGMYDTQLGELCSYSQASDGSVRCFPRVYGSAGEYYADPGCSVPLYTFSNTPASLLPKYVPGPIGWYAVGQAYTGLLFWLVNNNPTGCDVCGGTAPDGGVAIPCLPSSACNIPPTCTMVSIPVSGNYTVSVVPITLFVQATVQM